MYSNLGRINPKLRMVT